MRHGKLLLGVSIKYKNMLHWEEWQNISKHNQVWMSEVSGVCYNVWETQTINETLHRHIYGIRYILHN